MIVIKPSKYITYLDKNSLYSWSMSQYFSYTGFKWLNQKEIDKFCLNAIAKNTSDEYML